MKKAYLAISYSNRKFFNEEIKCLKTYYESKNIKLLVFVDKYNFKSNQEKEMMQTAFQEINSCDFLIAELSTKSIGVGIEIGYAFSQNKPIIYLYKDNSEYSTTASGCANFSIKYNNSTDLIKQISVLNFK